MKQQVVNFENYTIQDIEEINSFYEAEQEYFQLTNAYETITANINYYTEDQLHNLLALINIRLQKNY